MVIGRAADDEETHPLMIRANRVRRFLMPSLGGGARATLFGLPSGLSVTMPGTSPSGENRLPI